MVDQNTFVETVQSVLEIIKSSADPISRDEIMSYFKDMELNKAQEELVFEFLTKPHDDVPEENVLSSEEDDENVLTGESDSDDITDETSDKEAENITDSILPNTPVFKMYLDELKNLPKYTEAEQQALYQNLIDGDDSVINTISNFWLEYVLDMAKKLAVSSDGFEDVVQEGNMALFMRLTVLCGSHKMIDVETDLLKTIEDAMKECIRNQTGDAESTDAVVGKVSLVSRAVDHLKAEKGHEPSVEELSEYTSVSTEELSDLLELIKKASQK